MRAKLFNPVRTLQGHAAQVNCFSISADSKRLISGSLDGTARLWDLENGIELERISEQPEAVWAVAYGFSRYRQGNRGNSASLRPMTQGSFQMGELFS